MYVLIENVLKRLLRQKGLDRSFGQSVDKNVYESLIRSF